MYIYLSLSLYIYIYIHLSIYLSISLSFSLSLYIYIYIHVESRPRRVLKQVWVGTTPTSPPVRVFRDMVFTFLRNMLRLFEKCMCVLCIVFLRVGAH